VPTLPDPDDLAREVGQLELLEQYPPVELERLAVPAEELMQRLEHLLALLPRCELLDRHDQRRLVNDPDMAVDRFRELGERCQAVLGAGLREVLLGLLDHLLFELRREFLDHPFDVQVGVPDLEVLHSRELRHRGAIAPHGVEHDPVLVFGAIAIVAGGDQHAHSKALDVPLPRTGERLVEIVDVEHQPPLGRREHAEVRQVRVPAALHREP
jgi:hypothetical protein